MLSKKYIFVLAVAGLMVSCQKEVITPNNQETVSVSVDDTDPTVFRNSNGDPSSNSNGFNTTIGEVEVSMSAFKTKESEITDPNNDDDRNKKKKN